MNEADVELERALAFRIAYLQAQGQLSLSHEGWARALARVPDSHTDRLLKLSSALQAQYDDWAEHDGLDTEALAHRLRAALRVAKEQYPE